MSFEWNYPHFHVVTFKEKKSKNSEEYQHFAFCMELGIESSSDESPRKAFAAVIEDSVDLLVYFDNDSGTNTDELFNHLMEHAESTSNDIFWAEYRVTETMLAKVGNDTGHGFVAGLEEEIEKLRNRLKSEHKKKISDFEYLIGPKADMGVKVA